MAIGSTTVAHEESGGDQLVAILLAMAMFVLVADTSLMNLSISAVVHDLVIFWAVIGGLGAALLLPAMQSLIHGNFHGPMQRRAYALVGAAAAIAAAVGPPLHRLETDRHRRPGDQPSTVTFLRN